MFNTRNVYIQIRKHLYRSLCLFFISIGLFYLACAVAITVIPYYKQEIASELSKAIDKPIAFSKIKFNWRGFRLYAKVYGVNIGQQVEQPFQIQANHARSNSSPATVSMKDIGYFEILIQPVKSLFSLKIRFDKILINGGKIYINNQIVEKDLVDLDINKFNIKKYLSNILNHQYLGWINVDNVTLKNIEVIISTNKNKNKNILISDFIVAEAKLIQRRDSDYLYGIAYKVNNDKAKNRVREKIELAIRYNKDSKDKNNKLIPHKFYLAANDHELLLVIHDAIASKVKNLKKLTIDPNTEIKLWGEINNDDFEHFDLGKTIEAHITSPSIYFEFDQNNKINLEKIDGLIVYQGDDFSNQDKFKLDLINFKTRFADTAFIINSHIIKAGKDERTYIKSDLSFGHADLKSFIGNLPTFIIGEETRTWLTKNIQTGKLGSSRILTRGYFDDSFPYDPKYDKPEGIFILRAEILNTRLLYHPEWPKLENLDGILTLRGRDISIVSNRAMIQNNKISSLAAQIKGLGKDESDNLYIHAQTSSKGENLANLIDTTPLKKSLAGINKSTNINGSIGLDLNLIIPIAHRGKNEVAVNGKLFFNKCNLNVLDTPLLFTNLQGALDFTDHTVKSVDLLADFNNKPAPIKIDYKESNLNILLNSEFDSKYLLDYYKLDYNNAIYGNSKFDLALNIDKKDYLAVNVTSSLEGIQSNFPKILFNNRFNKQAGEKLETRLTITSNLNTDTVRYNLEIKNVQKDSKVINQSMSNFDYIRNNKYSALAVVTDDMVGNINFISEKNINDNKINAAFNKLALYSDQDFIDTQTTNFDFFNLPKISINIKNFTYNQELIGDVNFSTMSDSQTKIFKITEAEVHGGALDINFNATYKNNESYIKGLYKVLDLPRLVKLVDDFDFKDQIKFNGSYDLSWPGKLMAINLKSLTGDVSVDAGHGRIQDVKVGVGRVFSFFNLQSLEKRLRFDFSDVFEPGFKFDNVKGKFHINNGILNTDKIFITAGSADTELYGDIDVINKQYNINADVTPHMTSSLPVAAAVVGTPVAGAVVFLVDKILESPVDQLSERSYSVTGPWTNPVITKLNKKRGPLIEVSWLKEQQKNTEELLNDIFSSSQQ